MSTTLPDRSSEPDRTRFDLDDEAYDVRNRVRRALVGVLSRLLAERKELRSMKRMDPIAHHNQRGLHDPDDLPEWRR